MGRKKKRKKPIGKAAEALRARGEASPQGRQTMNSETFRPEPAADPQGGTAVIHEVTPEMMDEAAHRAAAMADGVAHHTIPHDARTVPSDAPAARDPVEAAAAEDALADGAMARDGGTEDAAPGDAVEGAVGHAVPQVAAADDALAGTAEVVSETAAEAGDAMVRTARAGLPGGADAFGQYNAKLLEMMRSNMASTTALFAALVQAKSVPEAVALNADHLRRQMDTLTTQGRDLAALAQTMALDALQPFKAR